MIRAWLAALALIALAAPAAARTAPAKSGTAQNDEVFYHIFQRSFRDSNGDGQGDLNGITQSLDYIQSLGATSILLTPLYPSHVYHNYFASNFEGIDPEYGTMEDFRRLVGEVHRRGMRIYLDMEFQYLAEDHPWWVEAHRDRNSPFADYMLWDDRKRGAAASGAFNLRSVEHFGGNSFAMTTVALKAAPVRAYFDQYMAKWVDPNGDGRFDDGVDGFRLDHMMDDLDSKGVLTNLFAEFWKPMFTKLRVINPRLRFVGEQADWQCDQCERQYGARYLSEGDVDYVFGFPLHTGIIAFSKAKLIAAIEGQKKAALPGKSYLNFAENHDLDRIASAPGITPEKLRTAAALATLVAGTPIIYYGQELGMKGVFADTYSTDENGIAVREAFKWGATDATPGTAIWYRRPGYGYWDNRFARDHDGISVEEEDRNPASLLNLYRKLLALRAAHPALQTGTTIVRDSAPDVLVVERHGREHFALVANLSNRAMTSPVAGTDLIAGGNGLLHPWQTALFRLR